MNHIDNKDPNAPDFLGMTDKMNKDEAKARLKALKQEVLQL